MCGEHQRCIVERSKLQGSSPHVRGARCCAVPDVDRLGIIPACAGSTPFPTASTECSGDHPRMCGEHPARRPQPSRAPGSSPHVRGALVARECVGEGYGIIPACAGSTRRWPRPSEPPWDHPRMCGEHCEEGEHGMMAAGSSPHVRGALHHQGPRHGR